MTFVLKIKLSNKMPIKRNTTNKNVKATLGYYIKCIQQIEVTRKIIMQSNGWSEATFYRRLKEFKKQL